MCDVPQAGQIIARCKFTIQQPVQSSVKSSHLRWRNVAEGDIAVQTLDSSALDSSMLDSSILNSNILDSSALGFSILDSSILDLNILDSSILDSSLLYSSILDSNILHNAIAVLLSSTIMHCSS